MYKNEMDKNIAKGALEILKPNIKDMYKKKMKGKKESEGEYEEEDGEECSMHEMGEGPMHEKMEGKDMEEEEDMTPPEKSSKKTKPETKIAIQILLANSKKKPKK